MEIAAEVKPKRKSRGRFHHGSLREAAIDLAVSEVEAHGHGALSVNHLAHRLGVTGPALYRHFADRQALLDEVGQRGYERFEAHLVRAFDAAPDAWSALLAVGRAYVEFAIANRGWFRLQFSSPKVERPVIDVQRAPPRYAAKMMATLEDQLGPEGVTHHYRALWALVHGLAMLITEDTFSTAHIEGPMTAYLNALRALAVARQI